MYKPQYQEVIAINRIEKWEEKKNNKTAEKAFIPASFSLLNCIFGHNFLNVVDRSVNIRAQSMPYRIVL